MASYEVGPLGFRKVTIENGVIAWGPWMETPWQRWPTSDDQITLTINVSDAAIKVRHERRNDGTA